MTENREKLPSMQSVKHACANIRREEEEVGGGGDL